VATSAGTLIVAPAVGVALSAGCVGCVETSEAFVVPGDVFELEHPAASVSSVAAARNRTIFVMNSPLEY
jgi:hypothetical protein